MFEILKGALGSVFGSKTPQGNSQVLEMIQKLLTGKAEKQRQFELELEKLFDKRLDKELADRADARDMQKAALSQSDVFAKRFIYFLSGGVILIIFLGLGGLFYFDIPKENTVIVNRVVDFFKDMGMTVLAIYIGTRLKKEKNG
jgi:hypothetical protein